MLTGTSAHQSTTFLYSWISFTQDAIFSLGTVHFLRGWGGAAGGIKGGHPPKNGLKGGPSQKNRGKGGHAKYFSSCRVDIMFYY